MDDKPILRCLIGFRYGEGYDAEYWVRNGDRDVTVTLEDAARWANLHFEVIVDPFDQEALARWEQLNQPRRIKWSSW